MADSTSRPQKLGELLIEAGALQPAQLEAALEQQKDYGRPLGMTLVRMGILDERLLVRTLATQLKLPVVELQGKRVNPEILELVPVDLAEKYRCLPLLVNGVGDAKVLYLGMEDPADREAVGEISSQIGMRVQVVLVSPTELDECIHRHYHWVSMDYERMADRLGDTGPTLASPDPDPRMDNLSLADAASMAAEELSFVEEPGVEEPVVEEPEVAEPLEFADSEESPVAEPEPQAAASAGNEPMLRAIAQLLIEKGVFSRDELVERLQAVMSKDDA